MRARGSCSASVKEVAAAYVESLRRGEELDRELASIRAEYERHIEFHKASHAELERVLAERSEWVKRDRGDRGGADTNWAHSLDAQYKELLGHFERVKAEGSGGGRGSGGAGGATVGAVGEEIGAVVKEKPRASREGSLWY